VYGLYAWVVVFGKGERQKIRLMLMFNMFNLEQSILEWRKQMLAAGIKTPVPLEELEIHLREEIERQMDSRLSEQKAFEVSVQQIGQAGILKTEFAKAGEMISERFKQIAFTLAGIPNSQLATNMNTTEFNSEPRWTIYAKAATFLFPAVILWLFTIVFVLPKANSICQAAGMTVFNLGHAPALFRILAMAGPVMIFLTQHCFFIGGAVILSLILMERYFTAWPRYRRAAIGFSAFLLNAMVILSLTIMIISILIAAPSLMHHVK